MSARMACRVPLFVVLFAAMLVLALVPAILVWIIVFFAMDESMDILMSSSRSSITTMAQSMQAMVIGKSMQAIAGHLAEVVEATETQMALFVFQGLPQMYLGPVPAAQVRVPGVVGDSLFATLPAHPRLSVTAIRALECPPAAPANCSRTFWSGQQALNYDFVLNRSQRTIWSSNWTLAPDRTYQTSEIYYRNQTTGAFARSIRTGTEPPLYVPLRSEPTWITDVIFGALSFQPELYYFPKPIPALNNTYFDMLVSLNMYTISEDLQAAVANTPEDRLFLFFRQSHGHLIGASHGKFFSLSDVDLRNVNPLKNPPNASLLRPYTCLESTDVIIWEACRELYATANGQWLQVQAATYDLPLNGSAYWVSVGLGDSAGFQYVVVSIKYRAAVLGRVDAQVAVADAEVQRKRVWSYIVLGVATGVAGVCPLFILCRAPPRPPTPRCAAPRALGDGQYINKVRSDGFISMTML
eukprot:EG_transcript_4926